MLKNLIFFFYESGLLRLNCNKARKVLKWKSVLKFDETAEMVANWYGNFYEDSKNIEQITEDQIIRYQSLAFQRGSNWAKIY